MQAARANGEQSPVWKRRHPVHGAARAMAACGTPAPRCRAHAAAITATCFLPHCSMPHCSIFTAQHRVNSWGQLQLVNLLGLWPRVDVSRCRGCRQRCHLTPGARPGGCALCRPCRCAAAPCPPVAAVLKSLICTGPGCAQPLHLFCHTLCSMCGVWDCSCLVRHTQLQYDTCRLWQVCTTAGLLAVGHQQGDVRLL